MIHNTLKDINVKDVRTMNIKGGLTVHIYRNIALDDKNYYMSVLSHSIINYALGTSDLMLAESRAISNLGFIIQQYINKYKETLDQINLNTECNGGLYQVKVSN